MSDHVHNETYSAVTDDWSWADGPDPKRHAFEPVAGHPDDDECTYREDGTDRTYCGEPREAHQ